MNGTEYNDLSDDIYNSLKPRLDKKLKHSIHKQIIRGIDYHKIYIASIQVTIEDKLHLFNQKNSVKSRDEHDTERFKAFNEACERIILDQYKLFPVSRFGYNNSCCFEITEYKKSINVFFTMAP